MSLRDLSCPGRYQHVSVALICSEWLQAEVASLAAPRPTNENRPANLPEAALTTQVAAPFVPWSEVTPQMMFRLNLLLLH